MNADILFTIGNILFLIASYPMIKEALKNRKSLNGFSFKGAFLTFIGMMFMTVAFITIGSYITALISIPTGLYWGTIAYYNHPMRTK